MVQEQTTRIGAYVREKRETRNLSMGALSRILGINHSLVSLWEAGKREIQPKYFQPLADALHVSITDLVIRSPLYVSPDTDQPNTLVQQLPMQAVLCQIQQTIQDYFSYAQFAAASESITQQFFSLSSNQGNLAGLLEQGELESAQIAAINLAIKAITLAATLDLSAPISSQTEQEVTA